MVLTEGSYFSMITLKYVAIEHTGYKYFTLMEQKKLKQSKQSITLPHLRLENRMKNAPQLTALASK